MFEAQEMSKPIGPVPADPIKACDGANWVLVSTNMSLAMLVLCLDLCLLFGGALLGRHQIALFCVVAVIFLLLTPTHWGLVHEAIHARLLPNRPANDLCGRALGVLFGFAFEMVRFGHLMHHRFNGHSNDRPDRIRPGTPRWLSAARHYGHLLGGHYVLVVTMGAISFAPSRVRDRLLQGTFSNSAPPEVAILRAMRAWSGSDSAILSTRCEGFAAIALLFLAFHSYGTYWPILLVVLFGRGFLFSVLDNLPHYGTTGNSRDAALNLSLPSPIALLFFQHNWHRCHHQQPDLDWLATSRLMAGSATDGSYLKAAIRQFKGPTRY
jgi:fatty acid desaturase